jgi:methionine-rich copper-binding protein CopC
MTAARAALRRITRLAFAAGLLALTGTVLLASSASAHDVLESTSPADGSTVSVTPAQVTLTFNQPAFAIGSQVLVTGPSGNVANGPVKIVDRVVTEQIRGGAPAGSYTVEWRVTSADGHPVDGKFGFTSQAASPVSAGGAAASPTPSVTSVGSTGSGSSNAWVLPVVVLAAVWVVALVFGLRLKQGSILPKADDDKRRRAREGH